MSSAWIPPAPECAAPLIEAALAHTRTTVDELGVTYPTRGPQDWLLRVATGIHYGLTLWPLIDPSRTVEAVVQKNLNWLWNLAIDDPIDRDGSVEELADSVLVLIRGPSAARTPAGALLGRHLAWAQRCGDAARLEVALSEVLAGHHYQLVARDHPAIIEPERYIRHNVATYTLDVHLEVDLLISDDPLTLAQVRHASLTYRELATAFRFAADVGAMRQTQPSRELNVIDVWRRCGAAEDDEALRDRAARITQERLARARNLAAAFHVPGLQDVVSFAAWLGPRMFDPPPFSGMAS